MKKVSILPVLLLSLFSCGNKPDDPIPPQKEVKYVLEYTSTDSAAVAPNNPDAFGAEILSNVYKDGVGEISFDEVVSFIGDQAFKGCATLKGIDLSGRGFATKAGEDAAGGITSIGASAFEGCTALLDITVPATVTSIGDAAFKGCTALRSINLLSETPPVAGSGVLDGTGCSVVVPADAESAYEQAGGWSGYSEQINGSLPEPDLIDLGLPSGLKWASCNVGASAPQETGLYFAWAETKVKDTGYNWLNYKYGTNLEVTKYNHSDGLVVLDALDDVATVYLGEKWRMPTSAEIQELLDNCDWTNKTLGGKAGREGKSKINGKTIFLPAAGQVEGAMEYSIFGEGESGYYWSSELYPPGTDAIDAYYLKFYGDEQAIYSNFRSAGYQVRAVQGDLVPVQSIVLDRSSLEVAKGEPAVLNATVIPESASLKYVHWTSNNGDIAVVSAGSGRVLGCAIGSALITARTADGGRIAVCQVTVKNPSYPVPEAVDLGLPSGLKWASSNLGASKPEDFGVYFAWGETEPNGAYSAAAYSLCEGDLNRLKKYVINPDHGTVDNLTTLEASDDAASELLKGNWRMPTEAEFQELLDNCTCAFATMNDVPGYRFTSKTNESSIFLPFAGAGISGRTGLTADSAGWFGYYWSSSLTQFIQYGPQPPDFYAVSLRVEATRSPVFDYQMVRFYGMPIRPVTP